MTGESPAPLSAAEREQLGHWKPFTSGEFIEAVRFWLRMSSYRRGKHSRYLATIDALTTERDARDREIADLRAALKKAKRWLDLPSTAGVHKYEGHIHARGCQACELRDFIASQLPVRAATKPEGVLARETKGEAG